jgi:putative membrane protein
VLACVVPNPRPPAAAPATVPVSRPVGLLGALWRGALMGVADVVPGVSGGTMALVLGVYARLLTALASLTRPPVWRALRARRLTLAWRAIDGTFLLGLVAGIAFSVIALAGVVEAALHAFRPQVYALFLGLIGASIVVVAGQVVRWRRAEALALLAAAGAATVLVGLAPISTPTSFAFLALTGAIGICALVLPGVSGAFLLVLLGQYETVLGAIARGDLRVLAPFALGAAVGLLAFARLLGGWLRRFPDPTHAALAGFLLGSLRRVWPWQVEDALRLTPQAPPTVAAALLALLLAAAGAAAVLALTRSVRLRRAGRTPGPPAPSSSH